MRVEPPDVRSIPLAVGFTGTAGSCRYTTRLLRAVSVMHSMTYLEERAS